jgi:TonB family protein
LAHGADVNYTNQAGQTALMLAALMGRAQILPILLEAGADPLIRDSHGLTALEWAQRRGFQEIIDLLGRGLHPSDPAAEPASQEDSMPARLRPQELGPATMAVLKTVHASLEAQRQKAGVATQMAPAAIDSSTMETADVREPQLASEPNGLGERERLFSAGFRKLEAQHRDSSDHDDDPAVHAPADTAPLVEPSLSSKELVTAPLVPPSSSSTPEAPNVFAPVDSDATVWSAPELEPEPRALESETQTGDEATVVAGEPVVLPEAQPAAPKASFLHTSILDRESQEPTTSPSVVRPVIWVVVIFALLGSVYLTYVLTTRFMNRGSSGQNSVAANTTSPSTTATGAGAKSSSQFPQTAGALANAESELPDAKYPAQAKNDSISGIVTVVVKVNRDGGDVTAARALNGDKLLRGAAEKAAKQARFSPQKLPDEGKVVSGTISYRFGNAPVPNNPTTDPDSPVLGGALVGTGLNVPKAETPDGPRSRNASGPVLVVARVNRFGEVIAAHALNGDAQLRAAAVKAAKEATFARDKLPTESLVTSGTITYNFKASAPTAVSATAAAPTPNPSPVTATPPAKATPDRPVVGGDLAGKEKNVPKAEYPAEARKKGISGTVTILIRVNKNGRVVSWRTLNGDSVLRPAALKAAKQATFSPEKLGNIDSILGTVTYTFQP